MSFTQPRQYCVLEEWTPDGTLVKLALAGDQTAFDCLVNRYRTILASYIGSFLKDSDRVSDVLQHVYLQLYLSLPVLLMDVPLHGWLFQVARNRCLDELRRMRRQA